MTKRTILSGWLLFLLPLLGYEPTIPLKEKLAKTVGRDRLPILKTLSDKDLRLTSGEFDAIGRELLSLSRKYRDIAGETLGMRTMALAAYQREEYASSLRILFESRALSARRGYTLGVIEANSEIGNLMFFCFANLPKALEYYTESFQQSKTIGHTMGMIKHLNNSAEIHLILGEYEKAVALYLDALTLFDQAKTLPIRVKAVLVKNIAMVNQRLGNTELAIQYLDRALPDFEKAGDRQNALSIKGMRALINGDYAISLRQFQEILTDIGIQASSQSKLAYNRQKASALKNIGEVQLAMGDLSGARTSFAEGLALAREAQDRSGIAKTLLLLSRLALADGDDESLMKYAGENERFCRDHNLNMELKDVLDLMAEAHARRGDYKNALLYRQKGDQLRRELREPRLAATVTAIMEKYEKTQMSKMIGLLKHRREEVMAIAALLLAILGIVLLGYLPRIRKRAHQQLIAKEQRLREQEIRLESLAERLRFMEREQEEWRTLKEKIAAAEGSKYSKSSLTPEDAKRYLKMLGEIIDKEKVYLDPELSLTTLAGRLGINRSYLSQIINEYLGMSFVEYINRFRLEHAKQVLLTLRNRKINILTLSLDVGFNSKASFYRLFKVATGSSPYEFWKKHQKDSPGEDRG